MYNKVKLSKRQLKEDKFTGVMLNTKQFTQENWQFMVIGLAVIVLVIVSLVYYSSNMKSQSIEASTKFSRAMLDYRNGNNQVAILSFSQIREDHPGDAVAEESTLLLGKINFESKNYAETIRYYEMYLAKYQGNLINRSAAHAGIAAAQENQGQSALAAAEFQLAYDEAPDGPLSGDNLIGSMRNNLKVGEVDKAKTSLELIEEKFPTTDLLNRATRLFAEKGLK